MVKLPKFSLNFILFASCCALLVLQPPSVNSKGAGKILTSSRRTLLPSTTSVSSRPSSSEDHNNGQFRLYRTFEKGHRSVTVYEGEKLKILCSVELLVAGANESEVDLYEFKWFKDNMELNLTAIEENKDDEAVVTSQLEFEYSEAKAHHRGRYRCSGEYNGTSSSFEYYVRVKGNLLPLWPLGGICVQVVFLGLILFIYEKRRDRHELEEEESDGEDEDGLKSRRRQSVDTHQSKN